MARREARRLGPDTLDDCRALLAAPPEGWCWCVAWEVPTWDGWTARDADQNHRLRESLWADGVFHGYVFYLDGAAIGWCRVGPTQAWPKLCRERGLTASADDHVFTCFGMRPEHRRRGLLHDFLALTLADLARRGVRRVFAVPRNAGPAPRDGEVWNGPAALFIKAGFSLERAAERYSVMTLALAPPAGD